MKKIFNFFKNLWFKYITEPRANAKALKLKEAEDIRISKEHAEKLAAIKNDFEERFNVKIDHINEIMYHDKVKTTNDPSARREYLNEQLVLGRKHMGTIARYVNKTPFLYDPSIVEIHNENLYLKSNKIGFDEVKSNETANAGKMLKKQGNKVGMWEHLGNSSKITDNVVNSSLNQIRIMSRASEMDELKKLDKDLEGFDVVGKFGEGSLNDLNFPENQNLDNFPTLKKLLNKNQ